jgi:hypothetical protein
MAKSASVEFFQSSTPYTTFTQLTFNQELYRGDPIQQMKRSVSIPKENITPGDIIFLGVKQEGPISANNLGARVSLNSDSGGKFSGQLYITSSAAAGPNLENIVEPYLTKKFINSDCDVLINNANQYQDNPFLQDLDFSSGTIVPVNYDQIVAGTAQKATVPESMFTMGGMINPNNSAVNQVDRYNISGSSYFGQTSGGTFVVYYSNHFSNGGGSLYLTDFNLKYIITPDGEAIQITNSDETLNFLRRLFGSKANPEDLWGTSGFGANNGEVNTRAIPISGSGAGGEMKYNGPSIIVEAGSQIRLRTKTFSATPPGNAIGSAGIVYPASIELTSHANLPSKARQILTENNIIPPEN